LAPPMLDSKPLYPRECRGKFACLLLVIMIIMLKLNLL